MRATVLLDQFIELETQIAAVLRARTQARFLTAGAGVERASAAGDLTAVEGGLLVEPEFTSRETRKLEMLSLACVALGAASVSTRKTRLWTNPRGARRALLENSVNLLQQLDRDYVRPEVAAAVVGDLQDQLSDDVLRKDDKDNPKPKKPRDLVPRDFGYVPLLKPPDWARARKKGEQSALAATEFAANLTTSRLVNYGALESMLVEDIGMYRIKAILDARTSRICRTMNGRVFEVREGITVLERALSVSSPDELRTAHPWMPSNKQALAELSALDGKSLQDRGYSVPPFHPRCRSVVVRAGQRQKTKTFRGVFTGDMLDELESAQTVTQLLSQLTAGSVHTLESNSLQMLIDAKNDGVNVSDDIYRAAGVEMGLRDLEWQE
jgi:hypothetical protein